MICNGISLLLWTMIACTQTHTNQFKGEKIKSYNDALAIDNATAHEHMCTLHWINLDDKEPSRATTTKTHMKRTNVGNNNNKMVKYYWILKQRPTAQRDEKKRCDEREPVKCIESKLNERKHNNDENSNWISPHASLRMMMVMIKDWRQLNKIRSEQHA